MKRSHEAVIARLRTFSPILNPQNRSGKNGFFLNVNASASLKGELTKRVGGTKFKGQVFNTEKGKYELSVMETLKRALASVEQEFVGYAQTMINQGNREPENWPEDLDKKKQDLKSHLQIHEEECIWLRARIEIVEKEEAKAVQRTDTGIFPNRQQWGQAVMKNGILHSIGGQLCELNSDGLFYISDENTHYCGMPVYQFKNDITEPMGIEYRFRINAENRAAKKENRPRHEVKYPAAPKWNSKTGEITYPGFSENIINRLKTKKS